MKKIEKPDNLSDKIKEKLARGGQELTDDELIQVLLFGWSETPMTHKEIAERLVWNTSYDDAGKLADRFAKRLGMTKKEFLALRKGHGV
jgi:DNA repair protein RadC